MNGSRILSVAAAHPQRRVSNAELPAELNSSDEWIRTRTGIESRGIAGEGESIVDMAVDAAGKAIASAGIDAAEVGLLIVATSTLPTPTPGGSPEVAHRLGIPGGAIDVNGACAGFCYALTLASDSVRAGSAKYAVVVGVERLTDWMDWTKRDVTVLFGDGAGAVVIGQTPEDENGIGPVVWGSDGSKRDLIMVQDWGRYLEMDGPSVFRWATVEVAEISRQACARAGIEPKDLAAFIPHQANLRIVEAAAKKLGLDDSTVVSDDVRINGNTSAASIPLALARLVEEGRIPSGGKVLLVGFGAGMCWASQVVTAP